MYRHHRSLTCHRGDSSFETLCLVFFLLLLAVAVVPFFLPKDGVSRYATPLGPRMLPQAKVGLTADRPTPAPLHPATLDTPPRGDRGMGILGEVGELLRADLEDAQAFSAAQKAVVIAAFPLNQNSWDVYSAMRSDSPSTATFAPRSAQAGALGDWRILEVRALDGQPATPDFQFFPDGDLTGGEVFFGWGDLRASVRLTTDGLSRLILPAP